MNNYTTPEKQARFLAENGKLQHYDRNIKYYEYNGAGYKVVKCRDGNFIVTRMALDEIDLIASCSDLDFDDF